MTFLSIFLRANFLLGGGGAQEAGSRGPAQEARLKRPGSRGPAQELLPHCQNIGKSLFQPTSNKFTCVDRDKTISDSSCGLARPAHQESDNYLADVAAAAEKKATPHLPCLHLSLSLPDGWTDGRTDARGEKVPADMDVVGGGGAFQRVLSSNNRVCYEN